MSAVVIWDREYYLKEASKQLGDVNIYEEVRDEFGSCSSPFIFNQFAEALSWILVCVFGIPHIIHYLDYFFLYASSFEECENDMAKVKLAFSELGVPLAPDKVIGPATVITYLGDSG